MTRQASVPWAELPPPTRTWNGPGAYDLCPRCKENEKRVQSAHCQGCSVEYRAIQSHVKSVVKNLVLNRRRVRFEFREGDTPVADVDDGLYDMVTIEWTCRHAWCGMVFTSAHYSDEWVLNDAEAVCPRCDTSLVLEQCDARLLGQEVRHADAR